MKQRAPAFCILPSAAMFTRLFAPAIAAFLVLSVFNARGQQPYLRAGAGWFIPFLTQTVTGDGALYAGSITAQQAPAGATATQYILQRASFGAGGSAQLAAGMFINGHVGLEIGAHIGIFNRVFTYTATDADEFGNSLIRTVEAGAERPIVLHPALVLRSGVTGRIQSYLRGGPALPLHTARVVNITETLRTPTTFRDYTITAQAIESSRFSVGLATAVGVSVPLWAHTAFFAECSATALQVYIRERTYTSFFYNGEDRTADIPESERTTWYEMDFTDNGPTPTGSTVRPAYSVPYSAVGLVAGVSIGW